jgi:hypothetical protein
MSNRRWLLMIFWVLAAVRANAQYTSAIKGQVVDPQGAIVAGATLTLTSSELAGRRASVSDGMGSYIFLGLPPGAYQLEAARPGFHTFTRSGIILRAGLTLILDVRLTLGGITQAVDVAARGGGKDIPIIDISNPEQKFNVSGEFINRLPLSSRQNWESVWFLVPGAVTIGRNGPDGIDFDPQVHGASERSNVYKLDGFEIGNAFRRPDQDLRPRRVHLPGARRLHQRHHQVRRRQISWVGVIFFPTAQLQWE